MAEVYIPRAGDWIGAFEAGNSARMASEKLQTSRKIGGFMASGDYKGAAQAAYGGGDYQTGAAISEMGAKQDLVRRRSELGAKVADGHGKEAVTKAYRYGDFEIARDLQKALDAAGDRERAFLKEKADHIAEVVAPLGDIPETDMPARKAYIQANREKLKSAGYTDEQLDTFEPTNANLAPIYTQALGLKSYLEMNAPKVVGNSLVRPNGKVVYSEPQYRNVGPGDTLVALGGDGGQGGSQGGGGPATAGGPTQAPRGGIYAQIGDIASKTGAQPPEVSYLQRLAQVESDGDPGASNGRSTGLFQFHPDTFASVGGNDINDVGQQTQAALALARRDRQNLQQLGIEPSDANVYIMHQQGAGGGRALLTAPPEVGAIAALTPIYGNAEIARKAIVGNGGSEDMTAGQFVDMWRQRWSGGRQGQATAQAQPAAPAAQGGGGEFGPGVRVVARGAPKPEFVTMTEAEVQAENLPPGNYQRNTSTREIKPMLAGVTLKQNAQAMQLRKEFNQLPDVKAFNEVAAAYDVISRLTGSTPTAAGDIGIIFNVMKMHDPTSVVREGEYATAQNAGGVEDRLRNAYNNALNGQRLNPNQRQQFVDTARNVYESRKTRYDQIVGEYQGYASESGFPDGTITSRLPAGQSSKPATQRPPAFKAATDAQWKAISNLKATGKPGERGNPLVPMSEGQYNKLPAGAFYIHPDGDLRQKGGR